MPKAFHSVFIGYKWLDIAGGILNGSKMELQLKMEVSASVIDVSIINVSIIY